MASIIDIDIKSSSCAFFRDKRNERTGYIVLSNRGTGEWHDVDQRYVVIRPVPGPPDAKSAFDGEWRVDGADFGCLAPLNRAADELHLIMTNPAFHYGNPPAKNPTYDR